jgi:hypothetical protein
MDRNLDTLLVMPLVLVGLVVGGALGWLGWKVRYS